MKKIGIICFLLLTFKLQAQNTLDKAKESVKTDKETRSNTDPGTGYNSNSSSNGNANFSRANNSDEGFFDSFLAQLAYQITLGLAKTVFIESPWEEESKSHFSTITKYPYFETSKGDFNYSNDENYKSARFQLGTEYLSTNTHIKGNYTKVDFQFANRFSATADFVYLNENDFNNEKTTYTHVTVLANYYRIRTERMSLWYGLGARMPMSGINKVGFAFTLGTRIFIVKPISVESHFIGSVVHGSNINQFSNKIIYHKQNKFFNAGYSQFKIGSEDFGGFTAGLGIYF